MHRNPAKPPKHPHRPPPDYSSRAVQLRLLVAVGALVFVLAAMSEARRPENWRWLWAGSPRSDVATAPSLDTRLPTPADPWSSGATIVSSDGRRPLEDSVPQADSVGQWDRAIRNRAWGAVWSRLSTAERSLLERRLLAARRARDNALTAETRSSLVAALDLGWQEYERAAARELEESAAQGDERQQVRAALRHAVGRWQDVERPALLSGALAPDQRAALADLQDVIDPIAWTEVRDDTAWRPDEQHAWFRLWERLQSETASTAAAEAAGFIQLYRQPELYRGKRVTIQGRVRLAYQVTAPENLLQLPSYYVLWIQPEGSQLSPYVVYCLELPQGFPEVGPKDAAGEGTQLDQQVRVAGVFFKRQAYRAHDGINTTPLLLARSPTWVPRLRTKPTGWYPSGAVLLSSMVLVALVAGGVVYLAYRTSTPRTTGLPPALSPQQLDDLALRAGADPQPVAERHTDPTQQGSGPP